MTRIAIYAGSFDPPGMFQRRVAEALSERFDEVLVVPSGVKPETQTLADSRPTHRAAMVDLAFQGLPRVRVDLDDIEESRFTPNADLEDRYRKSRDMVVSHVVLAEWIRDGGRRQSRIHRTWKRADQLWQQAHFTILTEPKEPVDPADLPPHHELLPTGPHLRPADLRSRIFHDEPVDGLLPPRVESYIVRHGLFRGVPVARESLFRVTEPRFRFFADEWNAESGTLAQELSRYKSDDPEMIVPIGGDGTMLRAIRQHWRERLPFYGLNTGHLGFLLNDKGDRTFWEQELILYQLPLLWVEVEALDGTRQHALAFNDTWVERHTGQTAWIEVKVNDQVRMPKLVADGMLISTAAGSTSYARAMGATPVPFNTAVLILAGSNVLMPEYWRPAVLQVDSRVELTTLNPEKRPLQCYIDGVYYGLVRSLRARVSNIASVELAFARSHDPVAKLARIQFPER